MSNEIILKKIEDMVNIANDIKEQNEGIGDIFLMNIMNSMDIIKAYNNKDNLDISDKIKLISSLLGVDLEEMVKHIIEKNSGINQSETEKDVVDFIINNSKIDDYEKFLQENSVKENLSYLKETI